MARAALLLVLTLAAPPGRAQEVVPPAPAAASAAAPEAPIGVPATAPAHRVRLDYQPGAFADRCPNAAALKQGVEALLGTSVFQEPADRFVVVTILGGAGAESATPVRARVEIYDGVLSSLGRRDLEARDGCDELVAAAALAVSIAVDPERALQLPAPPAPAVVPPPEPPAPRPLRALTLAFLPPLVEDDDVHLIAGAGTRVMFGDTPAFGEAGLTVAVGGRWRWISVTLEEGFGASAPSLILPAAQASFAASGSATTDLLPCAHLGPFLGCAVGRFGAVWAQPASLDVPTVALFGGAGLRAGLDWSVGAYGAMRVYGEVDANVPGVVFTQKGKPRLEQSVPSATVGIQFEAPLS